MELCDNNHEEVCFARGACPVCEAIEEKDKKIAILEDDLGSAKQAIEDYRNELGL